MSSSLMLAALVVCGLVAISAAYPQNPYAAPSYEAPAYKPAAYQAPGYKGPDGRVKIQVYRGPNKGYEKGYDAKGGYGDSFAPWGYYVQQPEDSKAYGAAY